MKSILENSQVTLLSLLAFQIKVEMILLVFLMFYGWMCFCLNKTFGICLTYTSCVQGEDFGLIFALSWFCVLWNECLVFWARWSFCPYVLLPVTLNTELWINYQKLSEYFILNNVNIWRVCMYVIVFKKMYCT
jgi:hypothetical protein